MNRDWEIMEFHDAETGKRSRLHQFYDHYEKADQGRLERYLNEKCVYCGR